MEMAGTSNPPPISASATADELRQEARRLQAENARLRSENRQLRATLDAYIARMQSTALFGPREMSPGTSEAPAETTTPGSE
jgi:regulator of replication initiation timing